MASVYSRVMNSLSVLIFSPNMNPVTTSYLEANCPACGNNAAVCVDVTLHWERIQLLRWAGWLTLGKVCKPVSPSLNMEVELDAGKRPIWEIKYQGATWPLILHVLGYFHKVWVSIQILVFAGDRNPARLSWGRKTNLSQVKGLSNSRKKPEPGIQTLSRHPSSNLSLTSLFSQLCSLKSTSLVSPKKFAKSLGSLLGQGNKLMCLAAASPTTRLVGERGSSPREGAAVQPQPGAPGKPAIPFVTHVPLSSTRVDWAPSALLEASAQLHCLWG